MTAQEILEEAEQEQVKLISETNLSRAERTKAVQAATEYTLAARDFAEAEKRKKKATEALLKLMQDKGEDKFKIPDLATCTVVTGRDRESLDKAKLIHVIMETGIDIKVIDQWLKKATKVTPSKPYCKVTPVKGEDSE